jgi:hypothetical protein
MESFSIEYHEAEFRDAIVLMNQRKCCHGNSTEEVSQENDTCKSTLKKASSRQGGSGQESGQA